MNGRLWVLMLAIGLSGCFGLEEERVGAKGGGTEIPDEGRRPPWDVRRVFGSIGDTAELFLNASGKVRMECREWDKKGNCVQGRSTDYDSAGHWIRQSSMTAGSAGVPFCSMEYRYGPDGRPLESRLFVPGNPRPVQVAGYEYDGAGRLVLLRRFSDSIGSSVVYRWEMRYGTSGRLDSLLQLDSLDRLIGLYHYAYDSAGRLEQETGRNGNYTRFDRDAAGRITAIKGGSDLTGWSYSDRVSYRADTIRIEPPLPWEAVGGPGYLD